MTEYTNVSETAFSASRGCLAFPIASWAALIHAGLRVRNLSNRAISRSMREYVRIEFAPRNRPTNHNTCLAASCQGWYTLGEALGSDRHFSLSRSNSLRMLSDVATCSQNSCIVSPFCLEEVGLLAIISAAVSPLDRGSVKQLTSRLQQLSDRRCFW